MKGLAAFALIILSLSTVGIVLAVPVFSYSADEQAIINAYANMSAAFANENLTAVMSYFSDDFLHGGEDKNKLQAEFQDFFDNSYDIRVNFTDIQISINGSYARTTHYLKVVAKPNGVGADEVIVDEYESDDWFNYWRKNGEWKIYGNQQRITVNVRTKYWESGLYQLSISANAAAGDVSSITTFGPSYIDNATVHGGGDPHQLYDDGMHHDDDANDGYWAVYLDITEVPNVGDNIIFNITYANGSTEIKQKNITGVFDETAILISPGDGATVKTKTPTFLWQPLPIPNLSYSLQIDDEYHNRVYEVYGLRTTNHTIPKNYLQNKKTYYWLVSAEDENSNEALTNWRTFTTDFIIPNFTVSGNVNAPSAIKQMMVVAFESGTIIDAYNINEIQPTGMALVSAGKYTFSLPAGDYFLSLGAVNFSGEDISFFTVLGTISDVIVDRNLTGKSFSVSSIGGNLTGTIKDENMLPVADMYVLAMQGRNFSGFTSTDENGIYSMPYLRSGTYTIWVENESQIFWVSNISITENKKTTLNFILKKWTVSGTIKDLTVGKIKDNLSLVVLEAGTVINASTFSDIEPSFFTILPGGNYNFSLPVGSYDIGLGVTRQIGDNTLFWTLLDKKTVTLTDKNLSGVNFSITSVGGNLSGFVDDGMAKVMSAAVLAMKGNGFFGVAFTNESGAYFMPYARPGIYDIWAVSDCYNPGVKYNVTINEGGTTTANLSISKRGFITDYYHDYTIDVDGDGFYDYLAIDIGLNITRADYYYMWGRLFANESHVAYANNFTYLNPGYRIMTLLFGGHEIYQSGLNGPYMLHFGLEKGYEYEHIDCREPAYIKLDYNYTQFQKPPAKFIDVYSDYGVDTDSNNLYDYLVVKVGVNVTKAGFYKIEGKLAEVPYYWYDGQYSYNYTYLDVGVHNVQLRYDGTKIYTSRTSGQYHLTNLYLYNETFFYYDYRYNAYNSSAYNYTQFQRPVVYFTERYADYGVDTDDNGLYNALVVEVGVNASETGYKSIRGSLCDFNDTCITGASNYTYLTNGTQMIKLFFDSVPIYQHGMNGRYKLKDLRICQEYYCYDYIDAINYAYNTSSYNYMQFQPPPVELTGNYSDFGKDTNGDGFYDFLTIQTGVYVREAGNYTLTGYLCPYDGYWDCQWKVNTTFLVNGTRKISIDFDGMDIYNQKMNKSYYFSAGLEDSFGRFLDSGGYQTSKYNYTQFQRPPATFTGFYYDYGLDTDGDGLYNYLTIEAEVNVSETGTYILAGYLCPSDGYGDCQWKANTTSLAKGIRKFSLNFDGMDIYIQKVNVSYYLSARLQDPNGRFLDSSEYQTLIYNYTQFQSPAKFSRVYSHRVNDTDRDGLYNYLAIDVGVNISRAGYYIMHGYLRAKNGSYIEVSNTSYLTSGLHNMSFFFSGMQLRELGVNGSYELKNLSLRDYWFLKNIEEIQSAYNTTFYSYDQFQIPMADLKVESWGPSRASPGQIIDYMIEVRNDGPRTAENVVLVAKLSNLTTYISSTDNGSYKWQTHEVIWKINNMTPETRKRLALRVILEWGIAWGTELGIVTEVGTTSDEIDAHANSNLSIYNIQEYLEYTPTEISSIDNLSEEEFSNELKNVDFRDVFNYSHEQGFDYINATTEIDFSDNSTMVIAPMVSRSKNEMEFVVKFSSEENVSYIIKMNQTAVSVFDREGGFSFDSNTNETYFWGAHHSCTWSQCVNDCLGEKIAKYGLKKALKYIFKKFWSVFWITYDCTACISPTTPDYMWEKYCGACVKSVIGIIPGGTEAYEVGECMVKCKKDTSSYGCTQNSICYRCSDWWYYPASFYTKYRCDENCLWQPVLFEGVECGEGSVCKQIDKCTAKCEDVKDEDKNTGTEETLIAVARDPNAKYGPKGHAEPGQMLNYTVEYENEGEGIAFGVYFTDTLDEALNDSILKIGHVLGKNGSIIGANGSYDPAARTITWFVGEVGPKEGGYANFSVGVRNDAQKNTSIVNFATVYFPSVPEETKTNTIITFVGLNRAPAVMTYKPLSHNLKLRTGFPIQFNQTSYDPDSDVIIYKWFLDKIEKNSTQAWLFTPTTAECGLHNITVNVNDVYGASASANWSTYIWLSGDVDGNRIVNIFDLAAVGLCFGKPATGNCTKADIHTPPGANGESEGNGVINIFDLAMVGKNFGMTCQ